jgi:hypothetical protein
MADQTRPLVLVVEDEILVRPGVPLVLTSGHVALHPDDIPDDGHFLPKPYHPGTVVSLMRSLAG